MNRKISLGAAITLIIVTIASTFSITMVIAMRNFDYNLTQVSKRQEMFEYITLVDKDVRQNYLGEINENKLRESLARGYIEGIDDPYAAYLTADEYRKETERLSGKWTGLGLEVVKMDDDSIVISSVHKNSAADKAGLQKGDVLTQLDGKDVKSYTLSQIMSKLGSAQKVKLTVNRGKDSTAFEISVSSYNLTSVESRMIGATGYIRITAFYGNTPNQFRDAYTKLESQGVENYIFDIRYNKGGNLKSVRDVISYLIPRGTYARLSKANSFEELVSTGAYEITKPSVTLVNKSTQGEAELFAGVMQEFKKTVVVGEKTLGRGMVQQYYSLAAEGAAIKISVASLSLTGGGILEGVGVTPSVPSIMPAALENQFAFLNEKNDPQLIAAISTIKGGAISTTTTTDSTTTTSAATKVPSTTETTK